MMSILIELAKKYLMARAREASTWRNLILMIGGTWATTHSVEVDALIPVCLAIVGFIGAITPDLLNKKPDSVTTQVVVTEEAPLSPESVDSTQVSPTIEPGFGDRAIRRPVKTTRTITVSVPDSGSSWLG